MNFSDCMNFSLCNIHSTLTAVSAGQIISTKKEELISILDNFNIQVCESLASAKKKNVFFFFFKY